MAGDPDLVRRGQRRDDALLQLDAEDATVGPHGAGAEIDRLA